jgi:hypothetical protein
VVLIDQTHALAGNITPGDAPGFPVTISQPGSYRLTGNLTVPDANTTAIVITADYVDLDLNGFGIIGPVLCNSSPAVCPASTQGIGIESGNGQTPGPKATRIFNGSVHGMGSSGLQLLGEGSTVEKVAADSNAAGGMIVNGNVFESVGDLNGSFGIFAIIVRDSSAHDNHGIGIQLDGSGGVGIGNVASFNGSHGISAPNATVINNTAVRNGGFGISAICPSSIVGNSIINNTQGSIQTDRAGCVLSNNATLP